jgi:hypothetical protein
MAAAFSFNGVPLAACSTRAPAHPCCSLVLLPQPYASAASIAVDRAECRTFRRTGTWSQADATLCSTSPNHSQLANSHRLSSTGRMSPAMPMLSPAASDSGHLRASFLVELRQLESLKPPELRLDGCTRTAPAAAFSVVFFVRLCLL